MTLNSYGGDLCPPVNLYVGENGGRIHFPPHHLNKATNTTNPELNSLPGEERGADDAHCLAPGKNCVLHELIHNLSTRPFEMCQV